MNWSEDDLAAIRGRLSAMRDSEVPGRLAHSPSPVEQRAGVTRSPAGERPAVVRNHRTTQPHKYRAEAMDGPDGMGGTRRYPSKREARAAERLEEERGVGGIVGYLPQVSLIVGQVGGKSIRHVLDFLVIIEVEEDGVTLRCRMREAKGRDLREGRRKRLALERMVGARVEVV